MKYESEIRGFNLMISTAEDLRKRALTSGEADKYTKVISDLRYKRDQLIKGIYASIP